MSAQTAQNGSLTSAQRWIAWLEESGMPVRTIALALGMRPHTVQRWKVGSNLPSEAAVQALRLLVTVRRLYPTLGSGRIWLLSDDELADELDGARTRTLAPWEVDRTIKREVTA